LRKSIKATLGVLTILLLGFSVHVYLWKDHSRKISRMTIDEKGNIYLVSSSVNKDSGIVTVSKHDTIGRMVWERSSSGLDIPPAIYTFPAIHIDDTDNIYLLTARFGKTDLIKFSPTGELLWKKRVPGAFLGRALVANNQNIGIVNNEFDNEFFAFAELENESESFSIIPIFTDPESTGRLLGVDKTGEFHVIDYARCKVLCIDIKDGVLLGEELNIPPPVNNVNRGSDGSIFDWDYMGNIEKYNKTGELLWKKSSMERIDGLILDSEANVYVHVHSSGKIQKFDQSGNLLWQLENKYRFDIFSLDANNDVYIVENRGIPVMKKFDSNGGLLWISPRLYISPFILWGALIASLFVYMIICHICSSKSCRKV